MTLTGTLHMRAVCRGPKTVVADTYFDGAFKVARPIYFTDDEPVVYSLHVGGGYVGGDRYHTEVELEENARLVLTTQSAAKIYKTPQEPVYQSMKVKLAAGSMFMYLPDPLIAYEQARFFQETNIYMEQGAKLFYSDVMTPGWSKSGEPFRYEWIRSKIKIFENNVLTTYDHLFLQPDESKLVSLLQMEGYTHAGSVFIVAPLAKEKKEELAGLLSQYNTTVRSGCSELQGGGCAIRLLGHATHEVEAVIFACADWLRAQEGQEPIALRKY